MATSSELTLYSTSSCHLCELALALLQPFIQRGWRVQEVDISAVDDLFERYGTTIPVLRLERTGDELNWPFSAAQVAELIGTAPRD